jgi:hypothetical protein
VTADRILISDDRPADRSLEIIQKYGAAAEYEGLPRVCILRPPERASLGGHDRFLLEQASSD